MGVDALFGWGMLALFAALAAAAIWIVVAQTSSRPLEKKYGRLSSGGALFNEAFHPTGAQALKAWEQDKLVEVPAPSPDKGPGAVDFDAGTVRIDVPSDDEGPAEAGPS